MLRSALVAALLILCACPQSTTGTGGGTGGSGGSGGSGGAGGSGGGTAGGTGGSGGDGGTGLVPCLEQPTALPRPSAALPCDLLPPGLKP